MVPLRPDPLSYRQRVKAATVQRLQSAEAQGDPTSAAWLAYGAALDGFGSNPLLHRAIKILESVPAADETGVPIQRNSGAIAILNYVRRNTAVPTKTTTELLVNLLSAMRPDHRFSPLHAPEQVFLLSLNAEEIRGANPQLLERLKEAAQRNSAGPIQGRLFSAAALKELGVTDPIQQPLAETPAEPGDVLAALWWDARYHSGSEFDRWWAALDTLEGTISLDATDPKAEAGAARVLLPWELAMLHEALEVQTRRPNAHVIFRIIPLHPRVRGIATPHFESGRYVTAVEQATRVLNELLQQKSGNVALSEVGLVQAIAGGNNPSLRFNKFLDQRSGKDEQRGLAQVLEGVFTAFRNPKGHKPEDHPLVVLDPFEALDQLVAISYLMNRIDSADV